MKRALQLHSLGPLKSIGMRLTFIVSIDPVMEIFLLNVLLHSLNLQTRKNFDVVFYNQTLLSESEIFAQLQL